MTTPTAKSLENSGNFCFARSWIASSGEHIGTIMVTALPHEPVRNSRVDGEPIAWLIHPHVTAMNGNGIAECKHCGCAFPVKEQ